MTENSKKLKILVTNDDGYDSHSLRELVKALTKFADVFVCAPMHNHSGDSFLINLTRPVVVKELPGKLIVRGSPVDCIMVALHEESLMPWRPDLTVSGVNYGSNIGHHVVYSGTCSTAGESANQGVPSIAFSLACLPSQNYPPRYLEEAALIAADLVQKLSPHLLSVPPMALNINIPDLPKDQIKEPVVVSLATENPPRHIFKVFDDEDLELHRYFMGLESIKTDNPKTDAYVIEKGHISITPLQHNMTDVGRVDEVASWLEELD